MAFPDNLRSLGELRSRYRRTRGGTQTGAQAGGVAFVFQGGGSLSAPQVGMLRALSEAGVLPDLVVGSSAGALNAVAFATDPTQPGLDRLEAVWMSLRRRKVARFSARTLLAAAEGRGDGLVSNSALRDLLGSTALPATLDGTSIPAHVVATDLGSGAAVVLSGGQTGPALLASCAFPGLYPPVEVAGRLLVDGGVSADVPVLQAEALGARVIYVLPAAGCDVAAPPPHRPLPLAFHALSQVLSSVAATNVAAARRPVHVLPAPSSQTTSPVDFRDTARLIEQGHQLTVRWLASQRADTPASQDLPVVRIAGAS
jgi:NTE family protein